MTSCGVKNVAEKGTYFLKLFHDSYINFSAKNMCPSNAKSSYFPLEMFFEKIR